MLRPSLPDTSLDGLSNTLWANVPLEYIFGFSDRNAGIGLIDDFVGFGPTAAVASNVGRYASNGVAYKSFEENSTSIAGSAAAGGVVALTATNTDNDDVNIQAGGGATCPFGVVPGTHGTLFFEARFKVNSVAASIANFFVGLAGAGACVTDGIISDSNAFVTNKSFLGFGRLDSSTTALGLFYNRNGGTTGTVAAVGTLAADTYIKAGFRWSGRSPNFLVPYINGVAMDGIAGTSKIVSAAATGATPWPDALMTLFAGIKQISTGTAGILTLDWWAAAQLSV